MDNCSRNTKDIGIVEKIKAYIKLLRPKQWVKNLFVVAPLVFAKHIFDYDYVVRVIAAFILFCLMSSGVYVLNDIIDCEKDKLHPKKKKRPIASGIIRKMEGCIVIAILLPLALIVSFYIDLYFGMVVLAYFINNMLYSFMVKHMVILDVMSIAFGFLLRVIGGAIIIRVYISPWILLCTLLLALFLGFSKRRNELVVLEKDAENHRKILEEYSLEFIDNMLSIVTASTVMAYSLYTFSTNSENYNMMLTIPFVLFGIFRYQYIIYKKNEGGSPEETVLSDIPLIVSIVLWGIVSVAILYF
ncbi:decaprenyl-phosphate phosphoribosyltransferase [Acetivibrio clariflavus]|uniref:decaprenyl-phosphate phosphoribosyltransferase n=1 Tax=Acetivibrio clariflavus TaxID=288965 RepID=UPI0005A02A42|nr:decaprenyl-phosphate phosphoribosyltransferase [Acetivibrio clariflavus]HOQ01050.1 decaprenyl-phosphate phosphoribosyltransferase [Acetivibrio clariflavus]HPU41377.1 decaprenyl-phosphate phosphoribosyltransferase [Acetivibrio clariflavus]